ncbi:hypothetical protein QYE76_063858 [Lolium multiflorum]|uniref:Retrotransposon gag domain-containing protein n=1 Tax=Lolium multiflorum TaxID=4521 RepID=A0AAD8W7F6_LOLMU|nr:hypothetical protein QYE76_063858 [Lolium multiflorum]
MADGTPVTYEELPDELKKRYDEVKVILEADLIGSYHRTRSHGVRRKEFSPQGALDGIDLSAPSEERTRSLRQEINYLVAHSLHRHSENLVNTLERVALRVIQEIMRHRYSPSGPALGRIKGVAAPVPSTAAICVGSTRSAGYPAFVVYKIGGDPSDYQFLPERPRRSLKGTSGKREERQRQEKQTWLTKYHPEPRAQLLQLAQSWKSKHGWLSRHRRIFEFNSCSHRRIRSSTILRDQFGMVPKRRAIGYSKPYPDDYEMIPLPPKYRLPDFSKFSGSDGSSSIEHVGRYLAQLGPASVSDQLRVRLFSQSLTGSAFGWYTSLPPDSIRTWKQLEEQFHMQYHSDASESGIADLAQLRQKRGEVTEYIRVSES